MRGSTGLCRGIAISAVAVLLAGCAEMTSVYHNRGIEPLPRILTMDAYQRNVLFANVDGQLRACGEASPDAFSALSASLAAEADVATKSGSVAAALSQSGATIERTQTVNLMRERMYRTCELYLSGAINRATLVVQAARDHRLMISVLAIEQLTRTARPASTVVSAGATSASLPNDTAIEMVESFRKERDAADATFKAATKAYDDADKTGKCSTNAAEPAEDPARADWRTCDTARATKNAREAELKTADARLGKALDMAGGNSGTGAISASTGAGAVNAGGGGAAPSDAAIEAVAGAITAIVKAPPVDEVLMYCIGYLSDHPIMSVEPAPTCMRILEARAAAEESHYASELRQMRDAGVTIAPPPDPSAGVMLHYLAQGERPERDRRMALMRKAARAIGLILDRAEMLRFLDGSDRNGTPEQKAALLDAVRQRETRPAGQADLNP